MREARDLHSLMERVGAFADDRDWGKFHDPKNLAMALASEVGELLAIFRWVDNGDSDSHAMRAEVSPAVRDEIGDVGILFLLLCRRLEIDPADIVLRKLEANGVKYPVEFSTGNPEPPTASA
jgi:NTP pyrophosphatase (non-canonical NTP hydrolase)